MKRTKIYLFALVCILLASCKGQYTKNTTILRAEALLNSSPDSAYRLLTSMVHPEDLSKADYAAWCLNYTYAQYKLDKNISSDSLIGISVNYYKHCNLPKQSVTSYYLWGCISEMHKNRAQAMQAYKQAESLFDKITNNKLKAVIYFKLGFISLQDELYNQSLNYFKKSRLYYHAIKNKSDEACAYRYIADIYYELGYPLKSIIHYSNLALKLSKDDVDKANYYSILSRQGELLLDHGGYARSKEYILQAYRHLPEQKNFYAAFLAYSYSKLNKPDSARYYLNIALTDTTNIDDRTLKYLAAAYVNKDVGKMNRAFDYLEKAYLNRDTVFQQSIHSQLYRIDKQFDLTKKEEENAQLKILNQGKVIMIGVLIIFLLVLSFGILYVINVHKKKMLKIDNLNQIKQQKMEYDLMLKQAENKQTQELLLVKLQNKINNTLFYNQLSMSYSQVDKKVEFEKMMIEQSVLTEKDWQYYIEEVNHIFDRKIDLFSVTYSDVSQLDLIVITLICLQVDIADSCSLLNMNKSTMYKRRNRIKERIGLEREIDLEDWLLFYLNSKVVEEEVLVG